MKARAMISSVIQRTALYFPYIEPPEPWIKQSLLLSDTLSSIVPADDRMEGLPPSLQWLESEGLYRPAVVRDGLGPDYVSDVEDVLLKFADEPEYRFTGSAFPDASSLDRIYLGKLTSHVEGLLQQLQLCKVGRFGGSVAVHRDVAGVLLAVTARHYAASQSGRHGAITPSSNLDSSIDHAFAGASRLDVLHMCQQVVFQDVLPVPGDAFSLQDVVDFRRTYDDELAEFRLAIADLVRGAAGQTDDSAEIVRSTLDNVDAAVRRLQRASEGKGRRLLTGAGAMLLTGAAVRIGTDADTLQSLAAGAMFSTGTGVAKRVIRGRPERDPLAYAFQARLTFG